MNIEQLIKEAKSELLAVAKENPEKLRDEIYVNIADMVTPIKAIELLEVAMSDITLVDYDDEIHGDNIGADEIIYYNIYYRLIDQLHGLWLDLKGDYEHRINVLTERFDALGIGQMDGLDAWPEQLLTDMVNELELAQERGLLSVETDAGLEKLGEIIGRYEEAFHAKN